VEDKVVNLFIIDDSFDSEEKIVSTLRTTGYTARSTRAEDDEDLLRALTTHTPDLLIYFEGMGLISLKQTIEYLKKDKRTENCRVIVVNKEQQPDIVAAMRAGAVDAVCFEDIDHLLLIITREHQASVSARKIATLKKSYKETERRCSSLLDSSRDAIAYIHEGMHIYSNQSYLEMFAIAESDDLEGLPILDMVTTAGRDAFKSFLRNYTKNETMVANLDTILTKPDGEEFSGQMEFSPAQIDGEPCIQIIIRAKDATSEGLERQIKLLSQKDQLTGLFNRQFFIEKLETTIAKCGKGEYTAALLEIHIDNFDHIKTTVGVVESDNYIIAAAQALSEAISDDDVLSRYTHDSFAVIGIGIDNNKDNIESYASKLQSAISQLEISINGSNINTTCCIGITLIDRDSPEYNDILARSEKALNTAIAKGVNQLSNYVPDKGELTQHEVDAKFKVQLTDALKNDKFVLHYQPIVSLHGDTEERYEVFIRLASAESDKLIMPVDFLPAAERIGMAIAIDRWVLYQTIQAYCKQKKQGKETRFLIKLSPSSVKDETLTDWLGYQIKEKQIPDFTLNFAIKVTVAVTNLKNTKVLSQKLKGLKCGLVLDDFGTGTNPFQLLEHINVDYIRIESSFMGNLAETSQNQESIKNIAAQATELGKLTIAQHVPDAGSLSLLWGMGINFIQGYFLQEPSSVLEYDFTEMSG
jgi:diguanylate cyclase (GGDEF)-like protein/PAS domain S-box-containing protein